MLNQTVKMQTWKYLVFASLSPAHPPIHNPVGIHSDLLMDSLTIFPTLKNRSADFQATWQLVYLILMSW